ncbi:MAG: cell division protein FtsZ [Patescibacteria group bacterium]|jgi:cell division protein FtsZ|nr:cell division protein FtsZ [Patescibacteria group bacterium]MDD5173037.1 cell division protein FtsZ [Patescibacteria group bacterium]
MKKNSAKISNGLKIKVIGVGGAGCSVVKRMAQKKISNVEYIVIDTDSQMLQTLSSSIKKIRIGKLLTKGLGAGGDFELGQQAAEQNTKELKEAVKRADIIFFTAGFGGGTGTGALPVIADLAEKTKALTIAIVTKPFVFEGVQRKAVAEQGLKKMLNRVDSLIVISNNKLLRAIDRSTPILGAFAIADEVIKQGVQMFFNIFNVPGLINVDFADIKPIIKNAGETFLGVGVASGKDRVNQAIKNILKNPLINVSPRGANGIILIISGSNDLKMAEVNEIAETITKQINPKARIVFGAIIDEKLKDEIKIILIASGFGQPRPHGFSVQNLDKNKLQEQGEEKRTFSMPRIIRKNDVYVYQEKDTSQTDKKTKEKRKEEIEINFENELDIPAFLRKKMKKGK